MLLVAVFSFVVAFTLTMTASVGATSPAATSHPGLWHGSNSLCPKPSSMR